ncbi:hypothetical protein L211DRAFT_896713 [Terfezia boudieri ATCC MYA-4762]|uniref:Uncharacterized protein n=1 Tax=Terfezia boudieri ATCC MYA-4762 TaxID=1051890 RepID=A0A3N4LVW7_9PEZI|nr:hypothetical protein L211DRAFT_896713 [Terfezia boudieri ATCC MYA-4762]
MPRVSQRKVLIEWFLWGIERHQAHLDQERFEEFLHRTMCQLQQELGDAMDVVMGEYRGDYGDDGSSMTLTVTVTLSETEDSDSISSLLSSEWMLLSQGSGEHRSLRMPRGSYATSDLA